MHHFISIMFLVLAFIGLHVSSERNIERTFTSVLSVHNGMTFGSWGQRDFCPRGTNAAGFSLKVEKPIFGDNTALNGIRLYCVSGSKDFNLYEEDQTAESDTGDWGKWTKIKWCPSGFLKAFQLRVEPYQVFKDDTAANNIRFNCTGGALLQGEGTDGGEWGDWSPVCQGKGICGIMTMIEEDQGFAADDTALNDVRMFCCD